MQDGYTLYSCKQSGGVVPEIVLALAGLPYEVKFFTWEELRQSPAVAHLHPLRQVPVLRLPSGELMTETLAICTYLCEAAGLALVPERHEAERAAYLRWSTFLVAAIYPTFTFGDVPSRYVDDATSQDRLRATTDAFRERLWQEVEAAAQGPWFLGTRQSLIDVYLAAMLHWRPRDAWFKTHCPQLAAIAERFRQNAAYQQVEAHNRTD